MTTQADLGNTWTSSSTTRWTEQSSLDTDHKIQKCKDNKDNADLSPSGWCSRWSRPQLPAGEVTCCPPEPRREKLPHLLSAGGGRRGRSAALARPGKKLPALQVPGAGTWEKKHLIYKVHQKNSYLRVFILCLLRVIVPKLALSMIKVTGGRFEKPSLSLSSARMILRYGIQLTPEHQN